MNSETNGHNFTMVMHSYENSKPGDVSVTRFQSPSAYSHPKKDNKAILTGTEEESSYTGWQGVSDV